MPSSNVCWGIEVGAGGVKAIRLERDGSGSKVTDFVVLPHKKVLSTPDLDQADALRVALGAFMSQYGEALRGATVALSVPGHSAFARFAKLPPVERKGVPNLVKFEAVQQIPFPIEQVEWDYQTFQSEDSPDIEVGIFAITRERVDERLNLWGEVGLAPDLLTISPVSAYNAIAYDLSFTEKTPGTIILDIGTTASDLIVAESGKVWIRTFPLGGHHFTEALAAQFKLNYAKAEKLKREAETSKYKRHILQALKPVLGDLVQDIQRSISYYEDTHPGAKITRLIGIGSTFRLPGIRKLLTQQLKLEVYRLERYKKITVDGPGAADFEAATVNLSTAYGLALQGLELTPIRVNLMPRSVVRKALWKRKTPWFVAAACLGVAGGALSFLRPFLDSNAIAAARADRELTLPVQEATRLGQQQKQKWQEVANLPQPGFTAENLRALFDRRDLFPLLLSDVSTMLSSAGNTPEGLPIFELKRLDTAYVPPGTSVGTARGRSDGAGGRAAGPRGAVRLTLTVDSAQPGERAFINDSILQWLRENAVRESAPYIFVEIPIADAVSMAEAQAGSDASAPTAQPGAAGRWSSAPAQASPTGPRDGATADESGGSTPGSGTGAAPAGGALGSPSGLPALPSVVVAARRTGMMRRYEITWVADMVDPASSLDDRKAAAAAAAAAPTAAEPAAPPPAGRRGAGASGGQVQ